MTPSGVEEIIRGEVVDKAGHPPKYQVRWADGAAEFLTERALRRLHPVMPQ